MTKWVSSKLIKSILFEIFSSLIFKTVLFYILAQYEVGRLVPSELFYFLLAQYYKRKLTPKTCFKKLKVWQKKYVIQFLEMTWPKRLKVQKCQFYYWAMYSAAANWTVGFKNFRNSKILILTTFKQNPGLWKSRVQLFFVKPAFRLILDREVSKIILPILKYLICHFLFFYSYFFALCVCRTS